MQSVVSQAKLSFPKLRRYGCASMFAQVCLHKTGCVCEWPAGHEVGTRPRPGQLRSLGLMAACALETREALDRLKMRRLAGNHVEEADSMAWTSGEGAASCMVYTVPRYNPRAALCWAS